MTRERVRFPFPNAEHFCGHLFMLLFATVAALALIRDWGMTYARLIPCATPGFIAFGVFGQVPVNDVPLGGIANSEWRARIFGPRFILGFTVMAPAVPILAWLHADWGFLTYCSERWPRAHA